MTSCFTYVSAKSGSWNTSFAYTTNVLRGSRHATRNGLSLSMPPLPGFGMMRRYPTPQMHIHCTISMSQACLSAATQQSLRHCTLCDSRSLDFSASSQLSVVLWAL